MSEAQEKDNVANTELITPVSDANKPVKRPLTFVSEGAADVETQKKKEEHQQTRYENERQRRKRKSLQDQLRANAIKKQKEFKKQVKQRESFNRLNKQELDYFDKVKKDEEEEETELKKYISDKISDFEIKKKLVGNIKSKPIDKPKITSTKPISVGVVKKPKKKIRISLKKLDQK